MCTTYMFDAGGQKRMSDALEQELWMAELPMWVLGTESQSSAKSKVLLTLEPSI